MNEPETPGPNRAGPGQGGNAGPNLKLFYSLIALAIAAAIAIAAVIVFPFYRRS